MICHVPVDIVMPIVQRYLDSYETYGDNTGGWARPRQVAKISPATILAEQAGLHPDTFRKYLNGRTQMLSFYTVDRLLCAMDQTMRWYEWPLLPFYLAADLSGPPPGFRVCAREGCDKEYRPTQSNHKYCTKYCQRYAMRIRWKKRHAWKVRQYHAAWMRSYREKYPGKTTTPEARALHAKHCRDYRARQREKVAA